MWYKWTYLQNNRVTDAENLLMVTKGEESRGGKEYIGTLGLTCAHYYI